MMVIRCNLITIRDAEAADQFPSWSGALNIDGSADRLRRATLILSLVFLFVFLLLTFSNNIALGSL
jgi:preprotein translocase subunit SecG